MKTYVIKEFNFDSQYFYTVMTDYQECKVSCKKKKSLKRIELS